MSYFARPGLATELADQLRGRAVFGDAMHVWYQELEQQGMWPPVDGQPLCKS